MGHHYIPQYYLKGFAQIPGEKLWQYDKLNGGKNYLPIKTIASEKKFYSTDLETSLAENIEAPANLVLRKIRERHQITNNDKMLLAKYMAVMYKRVPRGKQRLKENAPRICNELLKEYSEEFDIWASEEPDKIVLIEKRKNEFNEVIVKYSQDPPNEIWEQLIPPEKTPRIMAAMSLMTWTFLTFDEKPVFLTCDNPLFFFLDIGVGNPDSEITFPISSHITLWGTWRKDLHKNYITIKTQIVKEINRRTASNATRYVYSGYDESWLPSFVTKGDWQLNRLI